MWSDISICLHNSTFSWSILLKLLVTLLLTTRKISIPILWNVLRSFSLCAILLTANGFSDMLSVPRPQFKLWWHLSDCILDIGETKFKVVLIKLLLSLKKSKKRMVHGLFHTLFLQSHDYIWAICIIFREITKTGSIKYQICHRFMLIKRQHKFNFFFTKKELLFNVFTNKWPNGWVLLREI